MGKTIFVLVLSLICISCTSVGRLSKEATLNSDQESIFLIGVSPENYRISVFPGSLKDGRFDQSLLRPAAVFSAAENGFVIGKASVGDTLAITYIRVVNGKDSLFGVDFEPCRDAKTMIFEIPRGKVLYLGNVDYEIVGNELVAKYSQDIDSAKKFIDENYPNLSGKVTPWKYELLPTTESNMTTDRGHGRIKCYN